MRGAAPGPLAAVLTALGIVAGRAWAAPADTPYQGTWKVTVLAAAQETSAWLVRFDEVDKAGKLPGKVVAWLPQFKDTTLEGVKANPQVLRFTLTLAGDVYEVSAYPPKGKAKPTALLGSLLRRRGDRQELFPVRMDKTGLKGLDPETANRETEGFKELAKLAKVVDAEERDRGYAALVKKYAGKPMAYWASSLLLDGRLRLGAGADAVRQAAEAHVTAAAVYGRELELVERTVIAAALARNPKTAGLSLEFARKAARLLQDDDPADRQLAVLSLVAAGLRKSGKKEDKKEQKSVEERIGKLEERLDREFRARAVPFEVKKFAGRKDKGDRVALVELFTGAHAAPAVAAEVASDAALRRYGPKDVVLIRYHLHLPGSDALAGPAGEGRRAYYGVEGTPAAFVDGKPGPELAGAERFARERFDKLCAAVEKELGTAAGASLELKVGRDGDRLDIQARVGGLKETGAKVRLRLALVEDEVRYTGLNRRRLHRHVVRDLPGGAEGFELRRKASTHLVTVSLAEVRKRLEEHLNKQAKEQPFPTDERPLGLKDLKVVGFIQDDATRRVLQAVQADVPGPK